MFARDFAGALGFGFKVQEFGREDQSDQRSGREALTIGAVIITYRPMGFL